MLIIAQVNIMHGNAGTRSAQIRKCILFYATVYMFGRKRERERERK